MQMRECGVGDSLPGQSAWLLPTVVGAVFALFAAGCTSVPDVRMEPLETFQWHGHDEVTSPSPAESSSRVLPSPSPVLTAVKDRTLAVWADFMAYDAVGTLRTALAATADPGRRDEIYGDFLVNAIREHIAASPNEKIDYPLCVKGIDSGLASPPEWREITRREHLALDDMGQETELQFYYGHRSLFKRREVMLRNIDLVFADSKLSMRSAMGRFPLVMMLHYEQIGRGIVLHEVTRKLRSALKQETRKRQEGR